MSTALHEPLAPEALDAERVGLPAGGDGDPSPAVNTDRDARTAAPRIAIAFGTTMVGLRALTFGQRTGILPVPDVAGDGIHVHHFVWGITILGVVGFWGLVSRNAFGNPFLALLFGVGLAMVVDEFALWLTLRDVYFEPEGALSVILAVAVGAGLAAHALWRSLGLRLVIHINRTAR